MNRESIFNHIRTQKLKLTPVRRKLIDAFLQATQPLSYDQCKPWFTMDKTTFYRNMHAFESARIIRKIESDDKKWYFELATTEHAHFICDQCHAIKCLEDVPLQPLNGYTVDTVVYKGTCPQCNV